MLEIIHASTGTDLTTLEAVKDEGNIIGTSSDRQLSALISRASRWAESFIGVPSGGLSVATYRECVPGYGSRLLRLSRYPVRAVLRVFAGTDTGTAEELLTSDGDYRVQDAGAGLLSHDGGFPWTVTFAAPLFTGEPVPLGLQPQPGQERELYMVEYVAGFTLEGLSTDSPNWSTEQGTTSTGRTLPEDIEFAVNHKVDDYFNNRHAVKREKLGDVETEYRTAQDSPDLGEQLLQPYVRVVP